MGAVILDASVLIGLLDAADAHQAAELRAHHKHLRLPYAMVVACARNLGGELLTYDERLARLN